MNYKFSINNHLISKTDSIKFLGIFIDSRLTWKRHIEYDSSKLRKVSFLLLASSTLDEN